MPISSDAFNIDNLSQGETVYQRCIVIKGSCRSPVESGFLTVENQGASGSQNFPTQRHPVLQRRFTFLAMLSEGPNNLIIQLGSHYNRPALSPSPDTIIVSLNYYPLMNSPPLHLAIMVAKDSPLLIDCPPDKHGGLPDGHSHLDAVIAKFRITAYMWQALTAEDMRLKGLGRRSFRLEEERTADTTSQAFLDNRGRQWLPVSEAIRSTAKIHLIGTHKTVTELRDPNIAQQNRHANDKNRLFNIFLDALKDYGPPFDAPNHPIVAGLILDSHYSVEQNLIVAHAALGAHNGDGISLGMFGSHLTYSWPRFAEEINEYLLDTRAPGPTLGNDCGECDSMWEACSIGQGAFLHEVGHAFGAPHTTGIMARGYAEHWPRNFLPRTAYSVANNRQGVVVVEGQTRNNARWDLRDALSFKLFPHFWIPGDGIFEPGVRAETPSAVVIEQGEGGPSKLGIQLSCRAKVVQISFNDNPEPSPTVASPSNKVIYMMKDLESRFPRNSKKPLKLTVLGMNGKTRTIHDVWRLFGFRDIIRIPGSKVVLTKQSILCPQMEADQSKEPDDSSVWAWATLLAKPRDGLRSGFGSTKRVKSIDVRTGAFLDGLYVDFDDGERVNCGPRLKRNGGKHTFGGHAARQIDIIPSGSGNRVGSYADREIVMIEVARANNVITGMRIHLRDGTEGGELSGYGCVDETCTLEPPPGQRIVGFYGRNWWGQMCDAMFEFGVISAPRDVELPETVYGMKELMNTDGRRNDLPAALGKREQVKQRNREWLVYKAYHFLRRVSGKQR
ncbi:zinc metalloproteinase [Blastomyces dermatitidis ER-3]|uniref:Zinc metalloproteinase n=1 Tax=Ajellomyces dermatitidis (strain ER-3 / ATCC MYA-2586) TaxID=559297 RepID=A0ABX2VR76_AJEDR|nr:zinc metalloproteinase [Blastomyces dermatitidis ER-3]OAS99731.1 zinc metalloproteinase [Blastomyces dermatitidis ER-3]